MILDFSLLLLVKLSLWILFTFLVSHPRKKGITTLRIYQCWILNHKVIETCFEMLKSSEHENLRSYSSYWFSRFNWSPNLKLLFRIVITMYVYGEHAIQKMKQIDDFWTIINHYIAVTKLKKCTSHFGCTNTIFCDCTSTTTKQERFYTRGTLGSIRIPRLANIPTLFHDWPRSWK